MMTSSAVRPGSRHGPDDNPIGKNWIESMAIAVRGPTSTAISARSRPNESLLLENLPGYRQRMQSCTLTRSKLNRGKLWYIGTLSGGDLFFSFFSRPLKVFCRAISADTYQWFQNGSHLGSLFDLSHIQVPAEDIREHTVILHLSFIEAVMHRQPTWQYRNTNQAPNRSRSNPCNEQKDLVSQLVLWAQSTTKDYIRANEQKERML